MKKGQSLKPIEYLIPIGIVAIGFILVFLWVNGENEQFQSQVEISKATIGGTTILGDALDWTILNETMADRIRTDVAEWTDGDVVSGPFAQFRNTGGSFIAQYMKRTNPLLQYILYVNGREVARSDSEPEEPVSTSLPIPSANSLNLINVTMVYQK